MNTNMIPHMTANMAANMTTAPAAIRGCVSRKVELAGSMTAQDAVAQVARDYNPDVYWVGSVNEETAEADGFAVIEIEPMVG